MPVVFLTMIAGVGAGCLGALLGLGGGIFLIPVLNRVFGLPMALAMPVSLITVIATSNSVTFAAASRQFVNVRLALVLLVMTVLGASASTHLLDVLSPRATEMVFGVTSALSALTMILRLNRRNVIHDDTSALGALGGRFYDDDSRSSVSYRVRRLPVAMAMSLGAGVVSTVAGVGGGMLVVPTLNSWCGVPLRVAAATSAMMIGATAVPGVIGHYVRGNLTHPELAGAAVLGVLIGSRVGFWVGPRSDVRVLKVLMAVILFGVSVEYVFFPR